MKTKSLLITITISFFFWLPIIVRPLAPPGINTMRIVYAQGSSFYGDDYKESETKANIALAELLNSGENILNGLTGIGLASSVAAFVFQAFKLGKSGDSKSRAEAINNLIVIAITTACLAMAPYLFQLIIAILTFSG